MASQDSSVGRVSVTARRTLRTAPTYLFWACVVYAAFYAASVWYGSGGGQDPMISGPFGWLWGFSLLVVGGGVVLRLLRTK